MMRFSLRQLFVILTLGSVAFIGLIYLIQAAQALRGAAIHMNEAGHFASTGLALRTYEEMHGAFPPAAFVDSAGAPHMSWRVAILPHIEQQALFGSYQQGQPWNSPANSAACDVCLRSYAAPEFERSKLTNIVMPTGPGTIGDKSTKRDDITDRIDETILIIALKPSDIPWHEPRDLHISEITRAPDDPNRILIQGKLFRGAWCATADGRCLWLPADLDYDTFRAMLTISGGEKIDMSWAQK